MHRRLSSYCLLALALLPSVAFGQGTPPSYPSVYFIPGPQGPIGPPGPAGSGSAAPLASNTAPGLMRGDGSTITVDPATGTASVTGASAVPLTGPVLNSDTFLMVRGNGASATVYAVTPPQLAALQGSGGAQAGSGSTSAAAGYPISFAGAAGAPSGTQAITALPPSNFSTAGLDGGGNLLLPSAIYRYGTLQAAGTIPATGTITVTFKAGASGFLAIGRLDAAGANGGYVAFAPYGLFLGSRANGTDTHATAAAVLMGGHSTAGIRTASDGTWHPQVDGADIAVAAFTPPAVASGYVIIGSTDPASPRTAVSGISVQ